MRVCVRACVHACVPLLRVTLNKAVMPQRLQFAVNPLPAGAFLRHIAAGDRIARACFS